MEDGNIEAALGLCKMAEEKKLAAFNLHRAALQVHLARGDVHAAYRQLELMTKTTDADLTPLRNRLAALAARLSVAPPAL
jgi:hypothetical protein